MSWNFPLNTFNYLPRQMQDVSEYIQCPSILGKFRKKVCSDCRGEKNIKTHIEMYELTAKQADSPGFISWICPDTAFSLTPDSIQFWFCSLQACSDKYCAIFLWFQNDLQFHPDENAQVGLSIPHAMRTYVTSHQNRSHCQTMGVAPNYSLNYKHKLIIIKWKIHLPCWWSF